MPAVHGINNPGIPARRSPNRNGVRPSSGAAMWASGKLSHASSIMTMMTMTVENSLSPYWFLLHAPGMPGLIAIVGRPNVGKSALFNRIVGRRIAIVHDQPGVTPDRVSAEGEWHGHPFTIVDTGGIGLLRREKATDVIVRAAMEQVEIAIESANVIILVVNVQEGIVALDREAAERLRASGKPVLVAVNKVDTHRAETGSAEFAQLGFDKLFPVRAIHGEGIEPLMDTALALLPSTSVVDESMSPSLEA